MKPRINTAQFEALLKEAGVDLPASGTDEVTPNSWLTDKFPAVAGQFGEPFSISGEELDASLHELSDDFFAGILGEAGSPKQPAVWVRDEHRFYRYQPQLGIYVQVEPGELQMPIADLLHTCARECKTNVDMSNLQFRLNGPRRLGEVINRAKARLAVGRDFFTQAESCIPCNNGLLDLTTLELLDLSPASRLRNKLAIDYKPGATCNRFIDQVLAPALSKDAIRTLRNFFGLALTGVNLSQIILLMVGAGGDGKGVIARVLTGLVGARNVGSLRPTHLQDRFELSGMVGRTLLYGADVNTEFLWHRAAGVLKSLTSGDPVTVEFKGSNTRTELECRFNVFITCNALPKLRLDGDAKAWERRLEIIQFQPQKRTENNPKLSEEILKEEGSGILNFALEGLKELRSLNFNFPRSHAQQATIDEMLGQSASHEHFLRDCMVLSAPDQVTHSSAYSRYTRYCQQRGWSPLQRAEFTSAMNASIAAVFKLRERHDLVDHEGHPQRGWKGLGLR